MQQPVLCSTSIDVPVNHGVPKRGTRNVARQIVRALTSHTIDRTRTTTHFPAHTHTTKRGRQDKGRHNSPRPHLELQTNANVQAGRKVGLVERTRIRRHTHLVRHPPREQQDGNKDGTTRDRPRMSSITHKCRRERRAALVSSKRWPQPRTATHKVGKAVCAHQGRHVFVQPSVTEPSPKQHDAMQHNEGYMVRNSVLDREQDGRHNVNLTEGQ